MNNKGFAITTILYGTLILFCLLLVSMLGILSTYRNNLKLLIENNNGAREIISLNSELKVGDYVYYVPEASNYSTITTQTGYSVSQTIKPNNTKLWRVLKINDDGTIDIISNDVATDINGYGIYFRGRTGYEKILSYLPTLSQQYENSLYTVGSRYLKEEDLTTIENVFGTVEAMDDHGYYESYWILKVSGEVPEENNSSSWSGCATKDIDQNGDLRECFQLLLTKREKLGYSEDEHENAIRPIVILKSNLKYFGKGTIKSPKKIID